MRRGRDEGGKRKSQLCSFETVKDRKSKRRGNIDEVRRSDSLK